MNRNTIIAYLTSAAMGVGFIQGAPVQAALTKATVLYQPTTENFPNPERGFHSDIDLISGGDFSSVRQQGRSLARSYVRLDKFRETPLSSTFLNRLRQGFQNVRRAGVKVVLRFSYNFPTGDFDKAPDATLTQVLQHIAQLQPVLQDNADVIAVLQAGFIGAWGEWHSSANGLDSRANRAKILKALLAALPQNRMVQIRTPGYMRDVYPEPLTLSNAFDSSNLARTAHHNDCFLSNRTDAGTYEPDLFALKRYLATASPFIAVGGETCQVTPTEHRSDCPTALSELTRFHWSYLNAFFFKGDLERWKQEGCYAKIARNLGYRFQLVSSSFATQASPGGNLNGNFVIRNVGYASPFNPRGLELVLRNRATNQRYRFSILQSGSKTNDPRFWLPENDNITVPVSINLPRTLPLGLYDMFLNLPDPSLTLAMIPAYSIRLANQRTWQTQTGLNALLRTVRLSTVADK